MKIAYFISNRTVFPSDPSQISASSTVVQNIVANLKNRHEITIYAAKGSLYPGIKVIDLDLPPFQFDSNLLNNDWRTKAVVGMKQLYIGELFRKADQFDIIHLHTEPIYLAMPYVSLIKTPVLFTCHNEYHAFEENIYSYFDKKIFFSGLSKAQIKNMPFKEPPPVIYNGIEVDELPFQPQSKDYFLFLGRLVEDKGIHTFLELAKSKPNYEFIIAGKGSKDWENKIKTLTQESSNIRFLGMLPRRSKAWLEVLSQAKALIMPINYIDSCPLVAFEAMACGTPIIGFPKGALLEVVNNNFNGYLTEDCTLGSLINNIDKISQLSQDDYLTLRRNARQAVEKNYNAKTMAEKYEQLYEKIITNYKNKA